MIYFPCDPLVLDWFCRGVNSFFASKRSKIIWNAAAIRSQQFFSRMHSFTARDWFMACPPQTARKPSAPAEPTRYIVHVYIKLYLIMCCLGIQLGIFGQSPLCCGSASTHTSLPAVMISARLRPFNHNRSPSTLWLNAHFRPFNHNNPPSTLWLNAHFRPFNHNKPFPAFTFLTVALTLQIQDEKFGISLVKSYILEALWRQKSLSVAKPRACGLRQAD